MDYVINLLAIYGAASLVTTAIFCALFIKDARESKRYRARFATPKKGIK